MNMIFIMPGIVLLINQPGIKKPGNDSPAFLLQNNKLKARLDY